MSSSGGPRKIMGMTCGQVVLLLILLLVACAALSGGAYWVLTNPNLTGGPALPTVFHVNTPAPPTRTAGPVVLPPTWTLTPSPTSTITPTASDTPADTPPPPPTETTTPNPG